MEPVALREPSLALVLLALIAAVAPHPVRATEPVDAAPLEILGRQLVSLIERGNGEFDITETTTIPYLVGRSCYNWVVEYRPVARPVILTEELALPAPASHWGVEADQETAVATDRSSATTLRTFVGASGIASSGWCVAEGDPVGTYRFVIREGDREVARFTFTVGNLI